MVFTYLPGLDLIGQNGPMGSVADRDWVIAEAKTLGFDLCGIAPAEYFDELDHAKEWLARGYAGEMRYLHDERRGDPGSVVAGARSVIVCALNYNTALPPSTEAAAAASAAGEHRGWISRYAWGDDYHRVLSGKLDRLVISLGKRFGERFAGRAYVDTGPVVERAAAQRAGLGWLAKNTCLIHEDLGSWLFLGVIVTTLEFADSRTGATVLATDLCGNCRLCLEACPTGALVEPYVMDARRCISYLTIELRGAIPIEFRTAMGWQLFGCDICQDVCPWNRQAPPTPNGEFAPRDKLFAPELAWLLGLSENDFREVFRASPVRRTKWRGLMRNACIAAANVGSAPGLPDDPEIGQLRECLHRVANSGDEMLAEHARWALAQLAGPTQSTEAG
jgi:epoxyqueuosine reductase